VAVGDTSDLLVRTARAYLDEHGLEGLTLREIARRAGVSHGAPRRHFPTLAALCSVVATQGFRELHAAVAARVEAAGPEAGARERLAVAGHGYLAFALANPGPYSLMFRPDRCDLDDPELQEAGRAAFHQLLTVVAAAQDEGWRAGDRTADVAGVVWATVHGLATLTLQGSLPFTIGLHGGDPDPFHLVDLAQDLLGDTPIPEGASP
jgi:AcrR family transcriptional regulator